MYILAKRIEDQDGFTIHGLADDEKVLEAWMAAGGVGFNIEVSDDITAEPYLDIAAENLDE